MRWLIIFHMLTFAGYPAQQHLYPHHSFKTEKACEAHKRTKAYVRYVDQRFTPAAEEKDLSSFFYAECVRYKDLPEYLK